MQLMPEKIPFAERLALRMAEATQYSGLGRTSIYDAIRAGQIESTTVGKRRLIFRESLDKFLTPQKQP
jgi:excisionase family DNA binding protein